MKDQKIHLENLFRERGYKDFKWIDPVDIQVSQWVRLKCMFGCDEYGRTAACPPNTPSIEECRVFFGEYSLAAVFHFEKVVEKPEDRHEWSLGINEGLLDLERTVFLSGHHKAFLLFMDSCGLCKSCRTQRTECKKPFLSRPTPEALGVDVFATVRGIGYPIEVLSDYDKEMNRFAFLMIE